MPSNTDTIQDKVVLITGAAHRLGAVIARTLHAAGMRVVLHYHTSRDAAQALRDDLNAERPNSVALVHANLLDLGRIEPLVAESARAFERLDVLVNNASTFYPTPIGTITPGQWEDLIGSNLRAPLFLSQAAAPLLKQFGGCIVNIADIHAERPLKEHPVYSVAKAGLIMLTKALARELGPTVRCNAVAPGTILWPERNMDAMTKDRIIARTTLKRRGEPLEVARAVLFFIRDAGYVSGQVLAVDGGRSVTG